MNFNFPYKERCGISHLLSNGSRECIKIIELMCTYDPEERLVVLFLAVALQSSVDYFIANELV